MNAHAQPPANASSPNWGGGSFRSLPHNLEAEQALLGALFINNDALHAMGDFLKEEHFFEPLHGRIFSICSRVIGAGKRATPITIKGHLPEDEMVGEIPLKSYLVRLASAATTIYNVQDFASVIYEMSRRRALIGLGEDLSQTAFDPLVEATPDEMIESAEGRLYALAQAERFGGGFKAFDDSLAAAIDRAGEAYQRDGHLSGLSTGLVNLDSKLGGLQRSDLIVLAGRPAMGKTALATNIALAVARAHQVQHGETGTEAVHGGVVGFFSLEMSDEQLATRLVASEAEVSSTQIRRGEITEHQFERLVDASQRISTAKLFIDQTGGISIGQLAARARRLQRQHGLDLLVVDYIQLMQANSRKNQNRVQEVTEITAGLKALAKELDVPVIALSQLSRQVENRENKRPNLADLRESGSIEQDADVVLFVYRDEYYAERLIADPDAPDYEKNVQRYEAVRGKAEVIIAKARHGPTGIANLQFEPQYTRFADLAEADHIPTPFD